MESTIEGFFVGREQELARIRDAADRSSVAMIYGVAGMGKTELSHRVLALLRREPRWQDTVTMAIRVDARYAERFETILALRLAPPTRLAVADPEVDRDAVIAALEARPHLLVIDDAHEAPAAAAALIDAIMRRVSRSFTLVTSRVELDIATAPVAVRLGPLDDADARHLVRRLVERLELSGVDEDDVVRRAAGSPFQLRGLLAGWSRGEPSANPVRDAIAALSPEVRAALARVVAVSPCPLGGPAIEGLADPAAIARLRRSFLIIEQRGRLTVHDLVRDATIEVVGPEELAAARSAAAATAQEAFSHSRHPSHAVEALCLLTAAGQHEAAESVLQEAYPAIAAAGLDHLLVPTLDVLARAGSTGALLFQARALLRMARIDEADRLLAANIEGAGTALRWQYLALRGIAAQRRGDLAAAREHFAAARDVAPALRLRSRMAIHLADVLSFAGDGDRARRLLAEVEGDGELRDSDRARLRWSEALSFALEQRFVETLERVSLGRELAERAETPDLVHLLGMVQVVAYCETGDVRAARRTADELAASGGRVRLREEIGHLYVGIVELASGDVRAAVTTLGRAYEFSSRHRDEVLACLAGHFLGRALLAAGDAPGAHAILAETAKRAAVSGFVSLVDTGTIFAARAATSAGHLSEARIAVSGLVHDHPWSFLRAAAGAVEAYCLALSGELQAAREAMRRATADAQDREPLRTDLLVDSAEIETFGGDPDVAVATARAALRRETTLGRRYQQARSLAVLVAGLIARSGPEDLILARGHLEELVSLSEAMGSEHLLIRGGVLRSLLEARDRGTLGAKGLVDSVSPGGEAMPGAMAYLRFLGAVTPRYWIVSGGEGRFGDDRDVAEERRRRDLVIDVVGGVMSSRHAEHEVRNRPAVIDLVARLAVRRDCPVTADALYRSVWGARDYHPLRNRNTLYIALNRARKSLGEILPGRDVIVRARDGWMLAADLDVSLIRTDSSARGEREAHAGRRRAATEP